MTGPLIVAEVLDKSGRVHERFRLTQFPVTIGRGYGNDIILDDDFVSAEHARIELNEAGQAALMDLGSDNGSFALPQLDKISRLALGADTLVRLGHTLIRLRTPACEVPKARHDSLGINRASRWLANGLGAATTLCAVIALMLIEGYQSSMQTIRPEQLLLDALPVVLAIPVWAGLWALASRAFAHHTFYLAHVAIASLGVVGFYVLDIAAEYYAFALSAGVSADLIFEMAGGLAAAAMLYGHLRFATLLTPRVVATTATLVSAALVGLSLFTTHVQGLDFSDELPYPGELKPAMFKLSQSRTPAEFAHDTKQTTEALESGALD
jgi:hypothetical protein